MIHVRRLLRTIVIRGGGVGGGGVDIGGGMGWGDTSSGNIPVLKVRFSLRDLVKLLWGA